MDTASWFRLSVIALALLGGCARLPKAKTHYYLATSTLNVQAVRVLACDKQTHIHVASSVTTTVTNSPDTKTGPSGGYAFDLSTLHSSFSDADITFVLTSDGRLETVNATSTGQGGATLKTVGSIAATLGIFGFGTSDKALKDACEIINKTNDGKPITLTYNTSFDATEAQEKGKSKQMDADPGSAYYATHLGQVIGNVRATIIGSTYLEAPVSDGIAHTAYDSSEDVIHARQPALLHFKVEAVDVLQSPGETTSKFVVPISDDKVVFAGFGNYYAIPVKKPAIFGTKTISAEFTDAGALKKIQYVSKTGAGGLLDSVDSVLTKRQEANAAKAKALKDEADVIAANQRLILCETKPEDCK